MTVGRSDYRNLNLVSPFNPTPTAPVSAALVLTPDVALTRSPAPIIPPAPTRCTRLNSEFAAAAARLTGPQRTGGIGGSPRARLHNSRHRPAAAGSAPPCGGTLRRTRQSALCAALPYRRGARSEPRGTV